jgi:RNA-directed DNA polymerase
VYLHYALDVWFEETVKRHCQGNAVLYRYADDFVCAFEREDDAQRFYRVLPKRLAKFGLEVAEEKTRWIPFHRGAKPRFTFLGFEFYWGRNRFRKIVLNRRTDRKKYRAALVNFKVWCRKHRGLPKPLLFATLNRKLRGYWQYYGIRGNYESLKDYFHHVKAILLKWLNRCSQKQSYNVTGFIALLHDFRLLKPRLCHDF